MKQLPLISEQIQPQKRVNPSYKKYEEFSKTRLSKHFLMRDFLHCNVNSLAGICNYPDDVEHVIKAGKALCSMLLEPRLLEDESGSTLPVGRKILPDLDMNIFHGNTVVDADFSFVSGTVFDKTVPLNWSLSCLPRHFDVVVGNQIPHQCYQMVCSICRVSLEIIHRIAPIRQI